MLNSSYQERKGWTFKVWVAERFQVPRDKWAPAPNEHRLMHLCVLDPHFYCIVSCHIYSPFFSRTSASACQHLHTVFIAHLLGPECPVYHPLSLSYVYITAMPDRGVFIPLGLPFALGYTQFFKQWNKLLATRSRETDVAWGDVVWNTSTALPLSSSPNACAGRFSNLPAPMSQRSASLGHN